MDLLDNILPLFNENRIFTLQREDDRAIGVTRYKENIPRMIMDEYCGVKVEIVDVIFNKHPVNYTIVVSITDEDGFESKREFILDEVVYY